MENQTDTPTYEELRAAILVYTDVRTRLQGTDYDVWCARWESRTRLFALADRFPRQGRTTTEDRE